MTDSSRRATRRWPVALFIVVLALGTCYGSWLAAGAPDVLSFIRPPTATSAPSGPAPTRTLRPTRTPRPTKTPKPDHTPEPATPPDQPAGKKVGVVAGHWMNDSGAVCPDGLEEVSINLDIASRVVAILQYEGYNAELLSEFDDRLSGYKADAFVSIHADSCDIPDMSGFKAARLESSAIPEQDDRLLQCIIREYRDSSHLTFQENTITTDMTDYHAFRVIDPHTPAVIIELGFMDADRGLLTGHGYELAQGVARGIACFLEGQP